MEEVKGEGLRDQHIALVLVAPGTRWGFRVQGAGCRVQGAGCRVQGGCTRPCGPWRPEKRLAFSV